MNTSSASLIPSNDTDAHFRAWAQFIEDTLVTTGDWVVTSDTGQMTISSATKPASANTKVGYRVYRMDDTLQSTSPVFMRVDYGSGSSANTPGIWLTIGTGSDGAGTITNIRFNGGGVSSPTVMPSGNSSSGSYNSYGSADTNRVHCALFVSSSATQIMCFSIERSKDSSGDDTGDGLLFARTVSGPLNRSNYINLADASQAPTETGISFILANQNPSVFSDVVGVGIPIYFAGAMKQAGYGLGVTRTNDFGAEATFTMTLYANSITFRHLNSLTSTVPIGGSETSDSTSRVAMRYD